MNITTGIKRLDLLLGGGLEPGAAALVYGAPFLGKEVLARRFAAANAKAGLPSVMVLTNAGAGEVQKNLDQAEAGFSKSPAGKLIRYVDTYTLGAGGTGEAPNTEFLDSALDLNGLALAVARAQQSTPEAEQRVFVLDSVSTLIAYTSAQTAFRFLQTLIGRQRRAGATGLYLMDEGMHAEPEVQMFKHLMSGFLHVREASSRPQLKVQGLGAPVGQAWVDYRFDDTEFELTGSFTAGRIR